MYFLRKRRHERDQEAGLIFPWRGGRRHYTGKMLALMMTIGCFAFSVYALKLETLKTPILSQRTATVIMLDPDDPNCYNLMLQIEEASPFPLRWDPAYDGEVLAYIDSVSGDFLPKSWHYQPKIISLPQHEPDRGLVSIIKPDEDLLEALFDSWSEPADYGEVSPSGNLLMGTRFSMTEAVMKRLPKDGFILPLNLVTDDLYGQSFLFILEIDSEGKVQSALPLLGGTMGAVKISDAQRDLAVWLRSQRFKPSSTQGVVIELLELQIDVSRG